MAQKAAGVARGARGNRSGAARFLPGWGEVHQEQVAGRLYRRRTQSEVKAGCRTEIETTASLKALRLVVRFAFFDVVATSVHALIAELVILPLPRGLGQDRTAVLRKALCGTRKASRLWQRRLHEVLADAEWKASVIFASMYTLGDMRGTLGCWSDKHPRGNR